MFLPMFSIFTYWVLAVVLNMRTAVVTPTGVCVKLLPFPIGNGQRIKRVDISVCYSRHVIEYEDGSEIENFFIAGVQTANGQQIDVCIPFVTKPEAQRAAHDIGRILNNAGRAERPIPVHPVIRTTQDTTFGRQTVAWSVLLLLAVLVGIFWGP